MGGQQDTAGVDAEDEACRPPLPAGDARTWQVLVSGTCLDSLPWPGWGTSGWDSPTVPGWRG